MTQDSSHLKPQSSASSSGAMNPYDVGSAGAQSISTERRAAAIGLALLVGVGSFVIMSALLFGIVVAIAGKTMPAISYSGAFLSSGPGRQFLLLASAAAPMALLLGIFCYSRVMKAQRLIHEASIRREELRSQLQSLLQAERSTIASKETDSP